MKIAPTDEFPLTGNPWSDDIALLTNTGWWHMSDVAEAFEIDRPPIVSGVEVFETEYERPADVIGGHDTVFEKARLTPITITTRCSLKAESASEVQDALTLIRQKLTAAENRDEEILGFDAYKCMTRFGDRYGIAYDAIATDSSIDRLYNHPRLEIIWRLDDPIGYGQHLTGAPDSINYQGTWPAYFRAHDFTYLMNSSTGEQITTYDDAEASIDTSLNQVLYAKLMLNSQLFFIHKNDRLTGNGTLDLHERFI